MATRCETTFQRFFFFHTHTHTALVEAKAAVLKNTAMLEEEKHRML